MASQNASIDENSEATITGLLSTNGTDITRVEGDPSTHAILVDDNTTGSDNGGHIAATDENDRTTMFVESSDGDGVLIALYVNADGELLIDSN